MIVAALDKAPKTRQARARDSSSRKSLTRRHSRTRSGCRQGTQYWCRQQGLEAAATVLDRDRMLTCCQFPKAHWVRLRMRNPIESPFATFRLRTDAAKRFKKVSHATAVIWKMLLVAHQRFRRLHAPEWLKDIYHGAVYVNGVRTKA